MRISDHKFHLALAFLQRSHAAAILLLVLLAGCETPVDKSAIPVATAAPAAESRGGGSVVFGKATVLSSMAPKRWTETSCEEDLYWTCPDSFRLILVKDGDNSPIRHRLTGDGSFYWNLGPGRYYVAEWEWQMKGQLTNTLSGRIGGYFEVPAQDRAAYVGDIVIAFSGRRFVVGVQNHFPEAAAAYKTRFPGSEPPGKALMRIARAPDGAGSSVSSICAKKWGLDCTRNRVGVEAVSPAQHEDDFPKVNSLTPTLTWRALTDPAVHYDVVIYDAIPYGKWPRTRYLQGELVDSAFDLTTASYTPSKPLKAGRKYFWTVRLRKGSEVSTWTTMGYHKVGFFILAIVSEGISGSPFRLETP